MVAEPFKAYWIRDAPTGLTNIQHINTTCQSITQHFILYTIKIVSCEGDMFRPSLDHLQALFLLYIK